MKNAPPSLDPANKNSLAGTFSHIVRKMLQNISNMLPAQVIQYDRTENRVQVQPLIYILDTNGDQTSRAQIASIPVLQLGGGNFFISVNLVPGDLGWIIANDRDISQFLQTYSESIPNTFRIHDFADSLFIPDVMKGTVGSDDANNLVISSIDKTVKVSFASDRIIVTAPLVEITTTGSDPYPLRITGNTFVTGNLAASGTITPGATPPPPP